MAVPTTLLPAVLTDWAADLRAGRIGPTAGGVGAVEPAWAASGAMALTGHPDAAPLGLPVPLVARLDGALAVVRQLAADLGHPLPPPAGSAQHPPASAGQLLGERAAAAGLARQGQLSAGGAARLLPAADGWVAVNLARIDDLDLLPAWLEQDLPPAPADRPDSSRPGDAPRPGGDEPGEQAGARPWASLAAALATRPARPLAERAALLGLPVAVVADPAAAAADEQARARGQRYPFAPFLIDGQTPATSAAGGGARPCRPRPVDGFTVVDLSSLWAGPLCAHLLGLAGGRVIKVEGANRLDGARQGPAVFYDLLHAGHASVTVDLRTAPGRAALARLIGQADVVIEASRPRALDALGIDPAAMVARHPTLTWVAITGYGRTGPWRQRPAFGDDAAAAAGAVAVDAAGDPVFLADAIADPVTGLIAAAAALACLAAGGGRVVDIAMREAVGSLLAGRPVLPDRDPDAAGGAVVVAAPTIRAPAGTAAPAGADNARLLGGAAAC